MWLSGEFIVGVGGLEGKVVSVADVVLGGEVAMRLRVGLVAGAVVERGDGGGVCVASISSLSERFFLDRVTLVVGEGAGEDVIVLCQFRNHVCSETMVMFSHHI